MSSLTILVLVWFYVEKQLMDKIANHTWYTFWYVVPTLPMFQALPWLLLRIGLWPTLAGSAVITIVCLLYLPLS